MLPPAPPGTRNVRVRGLGIVIADDDLRERVERRFHWPMILLALAVLPLLAIELLQKPTGRIEFWVEVGFWMIWIAFLVEFVIKIGIAESRWEYVKRNWLDVVVILVPLLRPLRLTSLSRTIRLFKLRGVGFKLARSLVMLFVSFEVADRLLRRFGIERPEKPLYPPPMKMTRYTLMDEVTASRKRLEQWEVWYAEHTVFLEGQGVVTYEVPDEAPPLCDDPPSADGPLADSSSAD
ncbi:MAG: hypothetical protein ACI9U2_001300 [Bradymonadia bacterium]